MDIIIVAHFTWDFSKDENGRFSFLAKKLVEQGHTVEIVTSTFDHSEKKQRNKQIATWPFKITFLYEPGYPTNICIKRFFSHYIWGRNVIKYIRKREKPDTIYMAMPSLSAANKVAKFCQKQGIRNVIDIQDLWPEAFQMVVHIPVISDILFAPFRWIANGAYKRADDIVAVSSTYAKRGLQVNRKLTEEHVVYLGTQLSRFDEYKAFGCHINKPDGEKWIGYCGTLGNSYDLRSIFDALNTLHLPNLVFMVMGDGPKRQEFENYASSLPINVKFCGNLQYPQMCALLSQCDMVVNPIIGGAAQSIINKHADYAASGLPVINTQECKEYRELVEEYQMGFNCLNGNSNDIAEKIQWLLSDEQLCKEMGENARRCAEERFDRDNTYQKIIDLITQ